MLLHQFITSQRETIIARTRARVAKRNAPRATAEELDSGVPLFLTHFVDTLVRSSSSVPPAEMGTAATTHGKDRVRQGFTVGQVVHDYGDICQVVMELAVECNAHITNEEFKTLNACLDESIAGAVTEFGRVRERAAGDDSTERLGVFAHELRNLLGTALLSFESIKRGAVGASGTTGAMHGRSLLKLRDLIDRSLAEVRLEGGAAHMENLALSEILEEVQVTAAILADARGVVFTTAPFSHDVTVDVDRHLIASALANLLQNAIKFTPPKGHVTLRTRVTAARVLIDVEDECGGLPPGKLESLFRPFTQRSNNRTGIGLGLSIVLKAVRANSGEIDVLDAPGRGCTFTVSLPRVPLES